LKHDPLSLEMLGRRMGWDHVLLGSDYPFDMASTDPVGGVEGVQMSDVDQARVLQSNAERFLRPLGGS
ncbi:MAG: amidohydrolase family protein, partial [Acidimicrobiia bacterium]